MVLTTAAPPASTEVQTLRSAHDAVSQECDPAVAPTNVS
eukprot:SAG11_NODE_4248_length_1987_cov_1.788136_5_plen_38_part_01